MRIKISKYMKKRTIKDMENYSEPRTISTKWIILPILLIHFHAIWSLSVLSILKWRKYLIRFNYYPCYIDIIKNWTLNIKVTIAIIYTTNIFYVSIYKHLIFIHLTKCPTNPLHSAKSSLLLLNEHDLF